MPGAFFEGTQFITVDREVVKLFFPDGNVVVRPVLSDKLMIGNHTINNYKFIVCQGIVYMRGNEPWNKIIDTDETALVIDGVTNRVLIKGTPNGFDIVEPENRRSNHSVNRLQVLQIGGVVLRANIEW